METSRLTFLLFFVLVFFLLAAFVLYLFISRCTTPASQRLALWFKAQSEADRLVETMAAQTRCLMDGLRPCRRRDNIRKRKTQRQYQISSHMRENKDGATSATSRAEYDEETAMDEIWRRHQQQRTERSEVQDSVPVFNHGSGTGDQVAERKVEGDSACGSKLDRSLEELAGERLWEFVVGWCLIGCIFAGAALIVGANLKAQDGLSNEAPWTFNTEEGDSLMDSVVAHVMKIALGIKDFGDQLMEHGIFIFVTGINGFVLVRQRVYVRRRDYEADILQEDTPTTIIPNKQNEHETRETIERCNILSSGSHENLKGADDFYDYSGPIYPGEYLFQHERPECAQSVDNSTKEQHQERKKDNGDDENGDNDADCSPEFRSMSFLAWFNYLQVGILVIEFLQLFSFPLRELMEFYNQAEKTNDMYESAEVVLNVFRDATASTGQDAPANFSRLHYHDGMLSLGNSTIFSFTLHNSNDTTRTSRIVGNDSTPRSSEGSTRTFGQQQLFDWWQNMPLLDNATALAAPWIKNISISTDWIADNLPVWLPNITALMTNSSLASLAQSDLENIRNRLVNTAAGLISHGLSVPGSNTTNTTSSIGSLPTEDGSLKTYPPREDMAGDGDIVMQVVNSLGLQPSINTHDWYLLRFWSCFVVVQIGWIVALSIHGWNRRCRRLRREGKPHWPTISVGWVSCFIPVVSVLYLPILSTFLSSAACQSQAIHAYAYERFTQQEERARREGHGTFRPSNIFNSIVVTLLDPASTAAPSASSLLCTGPQVQPSLYLAFSLLGYTLAYLLFMVFLTSFERVPAKGEICFRPNGVAALKNLGLLLAVDFLLIQSPSQRRFRGLVSMAVMLAMACYTIRMKPCYWNKVNYWRTFSFSCVLYASLLVALLCPSPEPNKVKGERIGGKWVMAPNLKMGHAWTVGGGPKVMLSWIVAGWALLIIVFVVADKVFLWHWAKKKKTNKRVASDTVGSRSEEGPRPGFDFRQEQQGADAIEGTSLGATVHSMASGSHWSIVELGDVSDNPASQAQKDYQHTVRTKS
ncbi:hypothetical protein BC939DRAFT_137610 [Gamsiella multidivaricata]|uniref:uncharacterized protein n=1 Tax=Gamsiella multidivaricata TaxID=101098 RepID=UPI00221F158F|nr:uncharacterized protein BC939DRAFT_137610 [Gamsiella multidivaricata]KAI7824622.1 hypothetical protein BC939DRAFT_137610 [Gamsiella multidivaricata]